MHRLAVLLTSAILAIGLASGPARAQDGGGRDRGAEFDQVEEQMLRDQLERFLNDSARWDKEHERIVFERGGTKDLGPLEQPVGALLGRLVAPGEDGQLHLRDGVKLRPFAKVIEQYMADGGMEDIEKFQRMRREGGGENPFKDGIPPRVTKALAGLMKALEEQGRGGASDGEKKKERVVVRRRSGGDDGEGERDDRRPEPRERGARERPARESAGGSDVRERIERRIEERLNVDPRALEERLRMLRDMAAQAERDMARIREDLERQLDEFARSDEGQRLRRRAESEIRRITESDEFQKGVEDAQKRAMDFLASDRGQELQRRAFEFLDSDEGRELRKRVEEFLASDRGKSFAERFGNALKGFERQRQGARGREGRDDRTPREPRREGRPAPAPREDDGGSRGGEGKRSRLY
jgi:hypothetical protein